MPHPEPRIQCSSPHCTADNRLEETLCHRCKTPTIARYLWSNKAVALEKQEGAGGTRYLALSPQIFLDTQPSKPPVTPEEVPPDIVAYLQLFPCYPHVPQVYGLLDNTDAWLFDYGTVPLDRAGNLKSPQDLIPRLPSLWSNATAFQQLNWLWQMAKLWKPLLSKKVASTLLHEENIGINGQVVQFLELQYDRDYQPSLRNLGGLWKEWGETARPNIQDVILNLGIHLETGKIDDIRQAIAILDLTIARLGANKQYSYQIYALSDAGPNRSNNEDAAYPIFSDPQKIFQSEQSLTIVCDGVGGHEGGEIASGETINYLKSQISQLSLPEQTPGKILGKLKKYIDGSNDIISQRNDSEQRQERQRMGTTLVLALSRAHEMYLAHVGDSRIYWITPESCHQVTTDDDLASREVRLGYAVYRDSLQYPSAGALIQAIGMRDSAALHPNLQRYMVEDDCIFLLCTDGLSDFDRVEQYWRTEVLPILDDKQSVPNAVNRLVQIANRDNGHDNVTVALVRCQVSSDPGIEEIVSWSDVEPKIYESDIFTSSIWTGSFENSVLEDNTPPDPTQIPHNEMPSLPLIDDGDAKTAKKQPGWLKPLILGLIISTIAVLVVFFFLENKINPDDSENKEDERTSYLEQTNSDETIN